MINYACVFSPAVVSLIGGREVLLIVRGCGEQVTNGCRHLVNSQMEGSNFALLLGIESKPTRQSLGARAAVAKLIAFPLSRFPLFLICCCCGEIASCEEIAFYFDL